jgi:hypothetical protein
MIEELNMSSFAPIRWFVLALILSLTAAQCGRAQVALPNSYADYFKQSAVNYSTPNVPSSSAYLYDKYFYHRQTVSPYLNLGRPGTDLGTSYQTYVRPEIQRREAQAAATRAYVQQRKLEGRVGETRAIMKPMVPGQSTPSAYYNHWYGGWNR